MTRKQSSIYGTSIACAQASLPVLVILLTLLGFLLAPPHILHLRSAIRAQQHDQVGLRPDAPWILGLSQYGTGTAHNIMRMILSDMSQKAIFSPSSTR